MTIFSVGIVEALACLPVGGCSNIVTDIGQKATARCVHEYAWVCVCVHECVCVCVCMSVGVWYCLLSLFAAFRRNFSQQTSDKLRMVRIDNNIHCSSYSQAYLILQEKALNVLTQQSTILEDSEDDENISPIPTSADSPHGNGFLKLLVLSDKDQVGKVTF